MLMQILTHTPIWVFVLLAGLVGLGLQQRRTRSVHGLRLVLLPLAMFLLSLSSVYTSHGMAPSAWLGWAAGFGAIAAPGVARSFRNGLAAAWSARRFDVAGSWAPLALMLGIFAAKYLLAVLAAMGVALPWPATALACAVLGMLSGGLLACALRVLARPDAMLSVQATAPGA